MRGLRRLKARSLGIHSGTSADVSRASGRLSLASFSRPLGAWPPDPTPGGWRTLVSRVVPFPQEVGVRVGPDRHERPQDQCVGGRAVDGVVLEGRQSREVARLVPAVATPGRRSTPHPDEGELPRGELVAVAVKRPELEVPVGARRRAVGAAGVGTERLEDVERHERTIRRRGDSSTT